MVQGLIINVNHRRGVERGGMDDLLDANGNKAGLGEPAARWEGEAPVQAKHAVVDVSPLLGGEEVAWVDWSVMGVGLEMRP